MSACSRGAGWLTFEQGRVALVASRFIRRGRYREQLLDSQCAHHELC